MTDADDFVLRYADFALSDEQDALQAAFRTFFEKQCSTERVRAAEPLGWDRRTVASAAGPAPVGDGRHRRPRWRRRRTRRAGHRRRGGRVATRLPSRWSRPWSRRVCSRAVDDDAARAALERIFAGEVASIAVARARPGRQLVPAGAVAPIVVGLRDDALVLLADGRRAEPVANLASAPLAWLDLADGVEILTGAPARAAFRAAKDEWRILTAAALVGLG